MIIIFLILCIIAVYVITQMIYNKHIFRRKIKNIPSLDGHPLLGQALLLMKMSDEGEQLYYKLRFEAARNAVNKWTKVHLNSEWVNKISETKVQVICKKHLRMFV